MAAKRLSVNHLADFAGIGRGRLSEILAGNSSPTLKTVAKLADALEVPASLLLTKPDDP